MADREACVQYIQPSVLVTAVTPVRNPTGMPRAIHCIAAHSSEAPQPGRRLQRRASLITISSEKQADSDASQHTRPKSSLDTLAHVNHRIIPHPWLYLRATVSWLVSVLTATGTTWVTNLLTYLAVWSFLWPLQATLLAESLKKVSTFRIYSL